MYICQEIKLVFDKIQGQDFIIHDLNFYAIF